MAKKLLWRRLLNMRCPKCNADLITANTGTRGVGCEDEEGCGFYMRQEVFDRVVQAIYTGKADAGYRPQFGDDIQALDLLNNLDRGVIPPDFSDSVLMEPDQYLP